MDARFSIAILARSVAGRKTDIRNRAGTAARPMAAGGRTDTIALMSPTDRYERRALSREFSIAAENPV